MCPVTDPSANLSSIAEATDDFPAQAKKLNWMLPLAKDTHQTYIDHDCTMDSQGYPILPNRSTKFVLQPGDKFENFGSFDVPKVGLYITSLALGLLCATMIYVNTLALLQPAEGKLKSC
ncbi:hypothetical protein MJO28_002123 [Puccinia striiformis f. sp. tritici]|uniref:Uncharacterized protein n=2 Tax=Puccinia striiformis f. sp. tritici TaxID=168172 RepID=A0ACC0EV57_9BASI|nr:hypothetical protein MJO28_005111 [Puccinia striiformis f. sp. tritici]KAI7961634.1 hypothetical protein MJO28_002123 [Puccinia striiformis f. sp. tritici]